MILKADWIMVHSNDGETNYGTKEMKNGEKVMTLSELHQMANDVIELGSRNHLAYSYLFNDFLEVQQGIYKWNEESKSFHKDTSKLKLPENFDNKAFFEDIVNQKQKEFYASISRATRIPDLQKK